MRNWNCGVFGHHAAKSDKHSFCFRMEADFVELFSDTITPKRGAEPNERACVNLCLSEFLAADCLTKAPSCSRHRTTQLGRRVVTFHGCAVFPHVPLGWSQRKTRSQLESVVKPTAATKPRAALRGGSPRELVAPDPRTVWALVLTCLVTSEYAGQDHADACSE